MSRSIKKLFQELDFQSIAYLYLGKMSSVLVAFLFLPWYSNLLGPLQFGLVAIVISLQSLLMMLDLGMSTVVGREVAAGQLNIKEIIRIVLVAEQALIGFYLILALAVCLWIAVGGLTGISIFTGVVCIALFCLLVLQNVYYSAMLAKLEYRNASRIQLTWIIIRAFTSILILKYFSPTFSAFIFSQFGVSIIHYLASRKFTFKILWGHEKKSEINYFSIHDCWILIKKGRTLLFSGLAGAVAMQLDKPIISFFMTPSDVSPYFLAVTLSSAPVGMLAAPIVQYFQPKIINNIANKNLSLYRKNLRHFIIAICLFGLAPSIFLYVFNELIVNLWLHKASFNALVSTYSKILLVAYGISTIGYIPYVLLIAKSEYKFQANISILATIVVLSMVTFFAQKQNIEMVCYSYIVYFSIATISFVAKSIFKFKKL